jgi:hypothetical protein
LDWNRIGTDVRPSVTYLTSSALCDSLLFEFEHVYWSSTLRVANATSVISSKYLVFRILALQ